MSGQRWDDVQALFRAALERDPVQRAAFLREASAGDESLRAEVVSLLEHHAASSSFIEHPFALSGFPAADLPLTSVAADVTGTLKSPRFPDVTELPAGQQVGAYTILRKFGEGGMGVVYAAEQRHPHRSVALKVIRFGLASPALLRRFEHEAQVLGRLQHPGIAQIFEAGAFDAGRGPQPYFAMELVEGRALLDYAAARQLTTRERVELVVKICDAVQHAHQKGVIHRDLKPANILVSDEATEPRSHEGEDKRLPQSPSGASSLRGFVASPKVLDFGVARITDGDVAATGLETNVGQLVGTVRYMSPEQAAGDPAQVDTRSDVYALGIVTYELLSGRLPYDLAQKSVPQALRIISEADPVPLGAVARALRGDLETVVAKALAKDKARRYPAVSELAADLRRFLRDEPIAARPPSAAYQMRKFAARHTALVGGVAGIFAMLLLAVLGTSIGLRRAIRAEQDTAAVNTFFTSMLASVDPQQDGAEVRMYEVLDRAAADLDGAFPGRPAIESELRRTIGVTYFRLGRYQDAVTHLSRAHDLLTDLHGARHDATLRVSNELAYALRDIGRTDEALALAEPTYREALAALGPDHAVTQAARIGLAAIAKRFGRHEEAERLLRDAVARQPASDPDALTTLAALNDLANVLRERGNLAEAEEFMRETLSAARRVIGNDDPRTLAAIRGLGKVLQDRGALDEAEPLLREAVDSSRRMLGDNHPDTLTAMSVLATFVRRQGRLDESASLSRTAYEAHRLALGDEHEETLEAMAELAEVLGARGDKAGQEELQRRRLDISRRVFGDDNEDTLRAMSNLAVNLLGQGQRAEAEPLLRESLAGMQRVFGDEHPNTLTVMNNLAKLVQDADRLDEAETLYRKVIDVERRVLGDGHPSTLVTMSNLASTLHELQRDDESEALYREVLTQRRAGLGDNHPDTAVALFDLGTLLVGRQRLAEAQDLFQEALDIRQRAFGDDHRSTLVTMNNLGAVLNFQGRKDEARPIFERVHAAQQRVLGDQHRDTLASKANLAKLLTDAGQLDEAEALFRTALAGMTGNPTVKDATVAVLESNLAYCLTKQERFDEAEALLLASYPRIQAGLGPSDARTVAATKHLASLYKAWGKPEREAEYRAQLPK